MLTMTDIETMEHAADALQSYCDELEGGADHYVLNPDATLQELLPLHARLVRCVGYLRSAFPGIPARHESAALSLWQQAFVELYPYWKDKYAELYAPYLEHAA